MVDWSWALTVLALAGALVAVVRVGHRNDALRAEYSRLKEEHEGLGHYAANLAKGISAKEAELQAALEQAGQIPILMNQIRDRDDEIRRLQTRPTEFVLLPRTPSRPGETTVRQPDEWREQP